MMKINNGIYKYVNHIKKINYDKKYIIIADEENNYLYIDSFIDNSHNPFCLEKINTEDDFSLFIINKDKTTNIDTIINIYKYSLDNNSFSNDKKKEIYDEIVSKYNYIYEYYYELQDRLESSPILVDHYKYLLINFSLIYNFIDLGYYYLKIWFNNDSINRSVLNIGDVSNNNFYNGYVISMNNSYKDNFIYEINKYYKYHYLDLNLFEEVDYFFKEFSVNYYEKCLLFSYLVIIPIINYDNYIDVYSLIKYIEETYLFLEKNKEENEEHKDNFTD